MTNETQHTAAVAKELDDLREATKEATIIFKQAGEKIKKLKSINSELLAALENCAEFLEQQLPKSAQLIHARTAIANARLNTPLLESVVGTLIELIFDGDKTLATFAFPHGTRFRAGAYRVMLDVACLANQESEK